MKVFMVHSGVLLLQNKKSNLHLWMTFLISVQISQTAPDFIIGVFPHRTGIVQYKIRLFAVRLLKSDIFQRAIAEAVGCELVISFIDKETGKEVG